MTFSFHYIYSELKLLFCVGCHCVHSKGHAKNTWLKKKHIENAQKIEHYQQNCRNFSSMYYTVYGLIVKTILWRFMSTILHLFIITSSGLCGGGSRRRYIGYCLIFRLTCSSIDYIICLICNSTYCIRISIL